MTYVHHSMLRKKRLQITNLIKQKLLYIDTKLYLTHLKQNYNHPQFNNCTTEQKHQRNTITAMSKATKTKSPYQEMLQRGIDGYMAEEQPDSFTAIKPASTTPGDAAPPLSN